ncbi:MAG TPA: translational GTPase TypA [Chloroflexota bacterium]|nr:translational GTPase TypA [Chloroflexota bacterium]
MTAAPSLAAPGTPAPSGLRPRATLRNIAVIAHVDHGKTTLIDGLLKQSKTFRDADAAGTLIMDSNELERERGITVFAKNAAIRVGEVKVNLIDTPGHADFSSEVERTLSMADGCLLLVDAAEGPLPQTRFVLGLALKLGLRPLVVVNKVDRKDARPAEVVEEIADLFLELAHDPDQLSYPVIYTIARDGRAGLTPETLAPDLGPLFAAILKDVPPPVVDPDGPVQLLVSALDYDPHRGRIAVGRLVRGRLLRGQSVRCLGAPLSAPGAPGAPALPPATRLTELFLFQGLVRQAVDLAEAGDVAAVAGIPEAAIGDTIADAEHPEALPRLAITEPTVQLTIAPNTSPFAGQLGKAITSRQLKERLDRELQTNVGLRVRDTGTGDGFVVAGRGELHLAILLETLRREGLEFSVSRPEVILKREGGRTLEPVEEVVVTTPQAHVGTVTELVGPRQAVLELMTPDEGRGARLVYRMPTRGLIGLRGAILTTTRGTSSLTSRFLEYAPLGGPIPRQRNGAVVATEGGTTTSYAIANTQERATLFVAPGVPVYEGMVVGLNSRENDMPVNIVKEKKQTNIRSSTQDIAVKLEPPFVPSLDQFLELIAEDELLELTPKDLRLRKRHLTSQERERAARRAQ